MLDMISSDATAILPATNPFATPDQASRSERLVGFCSAKGGTDEPCETLAIAIDRLSVKSAAGVAIGDAVMFSFSEFGLVEATVMSVFENGFDASFEPSADSKLALYLGWLHEAQNAEGDKQTPPRIVPVKKVVTLGLPGEPNHLARIVDLSRSEVSVTTSKELVTDQPIMVGPRPGHVVDLFDGGATVEFDEVIAERDFDPLIDLRAPTGGDELR